jgi:hypothetical protein
MLRVIASRNAKEYFTQSLKREDYYSEGQEISGDWQGSAAQKLGLSGAVTQRLTLIPCVTIKSRGQRTVDATE